MLFSASDFPPRKYQNKKRPIFLSGVYTKNSVLDNQAVLEKSNTGVTRIQAWQKWNGRKQKNGVWLYKFAPRGNN